MKTKKARGLEAAILRIGGFPIHELESYRAKTIAERVVLRHYRIATYGTPGESLRATEMLYDRLMGRAATAELEDTSKTPQAPMLLVIPSTAMQEAPNPTLEPKTIEAKVTTKGEQTGGDRGSTGVIPVETVQNGNPPPEPASG